MKKILSTAVVLLFAVFAASCAAAFSADSDICVISREAGSGTRGAFVELFGVEAKDENGNKVDMTVSSADIYGSTGIVLTNVSENVNAIGYISLGALNDSVKALKINGVEATSENILNGSYSAARPFNIATLADPSPEARDFISFILSKEGQTVVYDSGYIPLSDTGAYSKTAASGKVVVAGSSSVSPLMEKLIEAYRQLNTDVTIELQQSDSTSGMKSTVNGICDIGMASRDLKDSELESGLIPTVIATDGIAVIVNPANTLDSLTSEQVRQIYTGEAVKWADVGAK